MKIIFFVAVALTVFYVNGLYSEKCKEAETSNDKLVRFLENANCTLVEKNRIFRQGLNQLQYKFQQGFAHLHNKFTLNPTTPISYPIVPRKDPSLTPRPSTLSTTENPPPTPSLNIVTRTTEPPTTFSSSTSSQRTDSTVPMLKPPVPTFPTYPVYPSDIDALVIENIALTGYEGLDHPIDIRMLLDNDAPTANSPQTLRLKRDVGSDDQSINQGKFQLLFSDRMT